VIVCWLLALAVAAGLLYLSFGMFAFGAVFAGFAIGTAGLIVYWSGWSWLLFGFLCTPAEAMSEFDGKKWTVLAVVTAIPILGLIALPSP
jgi:hypothetical protein